MAKNCLKERNMNKGIWENDEVKQLFEVVEKIKKENKPLKIAFELHANKYDRKPNSVRNYYYHEVDNLEKDKKRLGEIGVNLKKHTKSEIRYFSDEEEKELMDKIDKEVKQGISVRKACLNLSGGDIEKMLRYQNKYRNFISKKKEKGSEESDKIIKFSKRKIAITDDEIKALFMGIVKLVKRSTAEEIALHAKDELNGTKNELRRVISQLNSKENEIELLKKEFLKIKEENELLSKNIMKERSNKAERLRKKLEQKIANKKMYNLNG